jgi:Tol biopolymer transport system component
VGASGSDAIRLTTSPGSEHEPAWSPDGTRIAYTYRTSSEHTHIWIASDLPDFTVPVSPVTWSGIKRKFR